MLGTIIYSVKVRGKGTKISKAISTQSKVAVICLSTCASKLTGNNQTKKVINAI